MAQHRFSATSSSNNTSNLALNRPTCKFFLQNKCIHGPACFFSHATPETLTSDASSASPTTVNPSTSAHQHKIYCKYFLSGYCLRGSSCYYVHEYPDDNDDDAAWSKGISGLVAASHQSTDKGKGKDQTASSIVQATTDNSHSTTKEEPTCAICFESPTTFGLLAACSHAFCLSCIREWRKNRGPQSSISSSSDFDSNPTKTCPLCRIPSPFIIPSSTFPTTDQQKQQIVSRYQSTCAKIPCKYFERSSPGRRECPFGDECFFRHAEEGAPDVRVPARKPHRRRRRVPQASSLRVEGDELRGFLAALFGVGPDEDYLDWLDDSWSVNPLPDDEEETEFIRRVRELEEDNGEVVERSIDNISWDPSYSSLAHHEEFDDEDVDSEEDVINDGGDIDNDNDDTGWGRPSERSTTDWGTGWERSGEQNWDNWGQPNEQSWDNWGQPNEQSWDNWGQPNEQSWDNWGQPDEQSTADWNTGWGQPPVGGWGSNTPNNPWHQESHSSNSHDRRERSHRSQDNTSRSWVQLNRERDVYSRNRNPWS